MIEKLFPNLDENELLELWPTYKQDEKTIDSLTTTNILHANIALDSILDNNEKQQLEKMFFAPDGWYKNYSQSGMIQIKLAAMSLGLTNNVFTFDSTENQRILKVISLLSKEQQDLNMRCYMKQKTVTYFTLKKYLTEIKKQQELSITLYRGFNYKGALKEYAFSGLECWSTIPDIAERFAQNNGYVIEKKYSINNIFAGCRSTFKNKSNNIYMNNGFFVRREHEMIVENAENTILLDNNFYTPSYNFFIEG